MRQLELVHEEMRRDGMAWRCTQCGWSAAMGRLAPIFAYLPAFIENAFEGHDCREAGPEPADAYAGAPASSKQPY